MAGYIKFNRLWSKNSELWENDVVEANVCLEPKSRIGLELGFVAKRKSRLNLPSKRRQVATATTTKKAGWCVEINVDKGGGRAGVRISSREGRDERRKWQAQVNGRRGRGGWIHSQQPGESSFG